MIPTPGNERTSARQQPLAMSNGHAPGRARTTARRLVSVRQLRNTIEQLESEIAYRDLLIDEIDHRTKNTLQLAVLLLDEHADRAISDGFRQAIQGIQKQVAGLWHSHARLFRPIDNVELGIVVRIGEICTSARESFGRTCGEIAFSLDIADVRLERHQALSVMLIVNELVTNALKHAFPKGHGGTLSVALRIDKCAICHLVVADDGVGSEEPLRASTGLSLVASFAAGLRGAMRVQAQKGIAVTVSFPVSEITTRAGAERRPG